MPKNFEQFNKKSPEKITSEQKKAKEESVISRRKFLKGLGVLSAGSVAVFGLERTGKYVSEIISEIPDAEAEGAGEPGQYHIEPEPISKIINYDTLSVRLEPERVSRLKEYWKRRYGDPNDPNELHLKLKDSLSRMKPWDEKLKSIFALRGIPHELRYISIVESDFMLNARSSAGAVGPFQFMKKTAEAYGLRVGHLHDDRRDPIRSGDAASRFLKDLFKETGDLNLALASYNGGFVRDYFETDSQNPTYGGFLKFMEEKINSLKSSIASGNFEHTVLGGQALWRIARIYGIRVDDLKKVNNIGSQHILRIGEKLRIPFRDEGNKKIIFNKLTRGFKENINFPHQVNAVIEIIKEGKI